MTKSSLSIKQKAAGRDLNIILGITLATLTLLTIFNTQIMGFATNPDKSRLWRTLFMAMFQFGLTGLGMTVVALYRKESFAKFGLTRAHFIKLLQISYSLFVHSSTDVCLSVYLSMNAQSFTLQ